MRIRDVGVDDCLMGSWATVSSVIAYGELDLTWYLMALCLCMSSLQAK
jgi:hypothetical protein